MEVALGLAVSDPVIAPSASRSARVTSARAAVTRRPPRTGRSSAARSNAQRMLSCTISSARSPSARLARREEALVAPDGLAEALRRWRGRAGCSDLRARTGARPRRRAAVGRWPGSRSRGTPTADAGTRARPARRRDAAGRASVSFMRGDVLPADRAGSEPRREALEPEPRRIDLLEVLPRQPAHERAPGGGDRDEALALELAEPGANGRRRDAELLGELALHERRALGQLSVDDQLAERARDAVLDRFALLEGRDGRRGGFHRADSLLYARP